MEINDKLKQLNHEMELKEIERNHELKMKQLKHEMKLKEIERKHELEMLKLRGGCLGRIFGCN